MADLNPTNMILLRYNPMTSSADLYGEDDDAFIPNAVVRPLIRHDLYAETNGDDYDDDEHQDDEHDSGDDSDEEDLATSYSSISWLQNDMHEQSDNFITPAYEVYSMEAKTIDIANPDEDPSRTMMQKAALHDLQMYTKTQSAKSNHAEGSATGNASHRSLQGILKKHDSSERSFSRGKNVRFSTESAT